MRERMAGRKMVRMSTITLHVRGGEIEGDWVTIGVVVDKSAPKKSQKVPLYTRSHYRQASYFASNNVFIFYRFEIPVRSCFK